METQKLPSVITPSILLQPSAFGVIARDFKTKISGYQGKYTLSEIASRLGILPSYVGSTINYEEGKKVPISSAAAMRIYEFNKSNKSIIQVNYSRIEIRPRNAHKRKPDAPKITRHGNKNIYGTEGMQPAKREVVVPESQPVTIVEKVTKEVSQLQKPKRISFEWIKRIKFPTFKKRTDITNPEVIELINAYGPTILTILDNPKEVKTIMAAIKFVNTFGDFSSLSEEKQMIAIREYKNK